mgnify:CR=1 FL=1|tara:strand:- start:2974 stop:3555 length:582 start_codon:yes stop_codon:yes gene_type:complete
MKKVKVDRISYFPPNNGYAVFLKEIESSKYLPILVGINEAHAISRALEGQKIIRPMTHDLITNIIENFEAEVLKIIISSFKKGTFYSKIIINHKQIGEVFIDSRPSDAIAIALRTKAPILVEDYILKFAGIRENQNNRINYKQIVSEELEEVGKENSGMIDNLQSALNQAILDEKYELAAKLRDKIISLNIIK